VSEPTVKVTIEIEAAKEAAVTEFAIKFLRDRGYSVTPPNEQWETAREFNQRVGVGKTAIRRALKRPGCPNVFINWGRHFREKRIVGICSNADFDAFVKRFKRRKTIMKKHLRAEITATR
jgi:hypothetical protein